MTISKAIPPQLSNEIAAIIDEANKAVAITLSTITSSNMILSIFMSQSLNYFWDMINSFQIISALPLIKISLPSPTFQFFSFINDISNFQIYSINDIDPDDFQLSEYSAPKDVYFELMNF